MSPMKSPEKPSSRDVGKKDKVVVEKDEAEELLPGWRKEVKVRKSGSATKVDRYYTDPVTGYIFRSFKDVQRYLETGELGRLAIKPKTVEREEPSELKEPMSETLGQKRASTDKSESPARASKRVAGVNADAVSPPPSPTVSLPQRKTRQATRLAGIKVDAALLSQSPPPEPTTCQATRVAGVAVDASLPSPSGPEPKPHQTIRPAEVAVDASLPSKSPSLTNTKTDHQATRRSGSKTDASVPSPAAPKTRHATRLAGVTVDASLPSPSGPEPKAHQTIQPAEVAVDASSPSSLLTDTKTDHKATRRSGSKTDASVPSPAAPKTRQAVRQAGNILDSQPVLPPESKTRQANRVSGISDNASPASPPQPKTRRATRQAGITLDSPPPALPDTRTSRQATRTRLADLVAPKDTDKKTKVETITDNQSQNADPDAYINHNQEHQESNKKQEDNKQIEAGQATLRPCEDQQPPPPVVVPPVNSEKQESHVVNHKLSNPIPQDSYGYETDMKPDSSINFSINDLWTDPCIEFAVKTLTGAIPVTDLNKVENFSAPVEVPQEIWTDPCIEFAVKTLTGAIPVGEDDHLLQRPATSTNPQGMNLCQANVMSKHYETGHKNMQESVFPQLGNGGLQKPGWFVNGNNGQSSISRFF